MKGDPDGRGMPVGVKFVELILKPAREGLEKNEHPTLPGAGECYQHFLALFSSICMGAEECKKIL